MFKGSSPLDVDTEKYVERVVECGIAVHRTLGPGFFEPVYQNAMCLELVEQDVPFESEKRVVVRYRDRPVATQRLDFLVAGRVIVELKALKELEPIHYVQLMSYLRGTGLRVGLLMNFGGLSLRAGLKRIVV
jgi:GxxExxY protein